MKTKHRVFGYNYFLFQCNNNKLQIVSVQDRKEKCDPERAHNLQPNFLHIFAGFVFGTLSPSENIFFSILNF